MSFTVLLGIANAFKSLNDAFRREEELLDRVNYPANFYANETF